MMALGLYCLLIRSWHGCDLQSCPKPQAAFMFMSINLRQCYVLECVYLNAKTFIPSYSLCCLDVNKYARFRCTLKHNMAHLRWSFRTSWKRDVWMHVHLKNQDETIKCTLGCTSRKNPFQKNKNNTTDLFIRTRPFPSLSFETMPPKNQGWFGLVVILFRLGRSRTHIPLFPWTTTELCGVTKPSRSSICWSLEPESSIFFETPGVSNHDIPLLFFCKIFPPPSGIPL